MTISDALTRLIDALARDPGALASLVALMIIVGGVGSIILVVLSQRHRERMAMIEAGILPTAAALRRAVPPEATMGSPPPAQPMAPPPGAGPRRRPVWRTVMMVGAVILVYRLLFAHHAVHEAPATVATVTRVCPAPVHRHHHGSHAPLRSPAPRLPAEPYHPIPVLPPEAGSW